ncbi:MAG: hypothetical protein JO242_01840, partial [Streptosporangiaceae bacterium]|nr:hypothetical protein [Streptosporangiaceae bacterium]
MPETDPGYQDYRHRRSRGAPFAERMAGWSARHRRTAVLGWLILVAVVFAAG